MTTNEMYKMVCWACNRTIEIPAGKADQPEVRTCPHCKAPLHLDWRAEHARQ